ncbi:MAG TPA: acyl-CoA dehydrogenase family protein [Baekduia sp.]|nr:acyl-CoA dehydrogenase family protein [Baekduia sp.]
MDSLRELIIDCEEEMDRECRLPERLVDAMDEAGIFHTWHPREFGGLELHPLDYGQLVYEVELASRRAAKPDASSIRSLGTTESHQIKIGQAESELQAAWEFAKAATAASYDLLCESDADPAALRERGLVTAQAALHARQVAKRVSTMLFDVAGADSLFTERGIARRFRDVQTAGQHSLLTDDNYARVGLYYLTRDRPGGPEVPPAFGA